MDLELHRFCDASQKAYGACVYIRSISSNGKVNVSLLCSRGRVAPIKKATIPRLELCGALLLAQLIKICCDSWKRTLNIHYWCDSKVVLQWLHSKKPLGIFIQNRVQEIRKNSDISKWHYVNISEIPSDLISRDALPNQLLNSKVW